MRLNESGPSEWSDPVVVDLSRLSIAFGPEQALGGLRRNLVVVFITTGEPAEVIELSFSKPTFLLMRVCDTVQVVVGGYKCDPSPLTDLEIVIHANFLA